jgi:hypothetical protein
MSLMHKLSLQTMQEKILTALHNIAVKHDCELLWPYRLDIGRPPVSGKITVQPVGQLRTVATIEYKIGETDVYLHVSGPSDKYPEGKLVYKNTVPYTNNMEMGKALSFFDEHLISLLVTPFEPKSE